MNDYITEFFMTYSGILDERCVNKNRILLEPNVDDPLEMKYRESYYNYINDVATLLHNRDDLTLLDFDEEYGLEFMVELIETYKKTKSLDDLKEKYYSYTDPNKEAIIEYQLLYFDDDDLEIIADILDYDLNDEDDYNEFSNCLELISEASNEGFRDINNSEEMMYEIEVNESFSELYKKTMRMNLFDISDFVYKKERIIN